ncbi:acyltransferase family protein [Serratia odorifera]|uniref:acyltransferase family protein n=1 Tax=Serratia odorifera TaxID=618 RepID=UPI0018E6F113|nr:acyltransferase [Serratia odorifera]MBJ2067508.1 acyltransferase [Serratia odorifera]
MKNNNIESIQLLRGIAALMVVFGHNRSLLGDINSGSFMDYLTLNAAFGVEIFFIISGFIIAYSTKRLLSYPIVDFTIKRFFRVYPLYFMVFSLFIMVIGYNSSSGTWLGPEFSLTNVLKSYLLLPLDPNNIAPYYGWGTLVVSWTLGYEVYFYLLFALSMALSKKYRSYLCALLLVAGYLLGCMLPGGQFTLDANSFTIADIGAWRNVGFIFNPIVLDFVLGLMLAELYQSKYSRLFHHKPTAVLMIPIFIICILFWLTGYRAGQGITHSAVIALALIVALLTMEHAFKLTLPSVLVNIGAYSYSLYLIHVPVLKFIQIHGDRLPGLPANEGVVKYIYSISLSISLSIILYYFVEQRLIKFARNICRRIENSSQPG